VWAGLVLLAAGSTAVGACSDDGGPDPQPDAAGFEDAETDAGPTDPGLDATTGDADASAPPFPDSFCDPLVPQVCALPWPSNLYLTEGDDADELAFVLGSLAVNRDEVPFEVSRLQVHDGYSVDTPIVTLFPNLDASDLPNEQQIEASLAEDANVLLYRREGIELVRVPHWVETDLAEADPEQRLMFVRPAERLSPDTLYIVAFRDLVSVRGERIPRSEAFQALIDRQTAGTFLEARQEQFDETLSSLVEDGVEPDSIQLAWSFRTVRRPRLLFKLQALRQAYDQLRESEGPVPFTVTSTTLHPDDPNRLVTLEGTMQVPDFLRPETINGFTGEVLNTAGDPRPVPVGVRTVPFRIDVPSSAENVVNDPPRSVVVQVGHPFQSDRNVLESPGLQRLAQEQRFILVATDWPGLTAADAAETAAATHDLNRIQIITDRILQSFVNQWALADAIQSYYSQDFVLSILNTVPGEVNYYGIESGAALGPALLATTPVLKRGVLAAGAHDVVTAAGRSRIGAGFVEGPEDDLVDAYGRRADAWVAVLTAQMMFDYAQSSLWAGLLEGAAAREADFFASRALFTGVVGDRVAPTVDLETLTRTSTYPVSLLDNRPPGRDGVALETAPFPLAGSGVVLFEAGSPYPEPGPRVPEGDPPDPHDVYLERADHRSLLRRFIETGVIEDVCAGVCSGD